MMDQRELDLRLKALQKAVAEKEPASNVVAILETLKKEVVPTEELLRVRAWSQRAFLMVAIGLLRSLFFLTVTDLCRQLKLE